MSNLLETKEGRTTRAFKFIDGKLVELTGWKDWPATLVEMVAEEAKPRLVPMYFKVKEVVWEGHRIATTDDLELARRIACIVYLPKGKEVDDEVLRAVELWEAEMRTR